MITFLARASAAIGVLTVLSGGVQLVAPALVLGALDAEATATSSHFFRIVGMFMMLFGGLLLQVWWSDAEPRSSVAIYWCALQKAGAVTAVGCGVALGLFSSMALAVAGFDLLSALILFLYARSLT